MRSSKAIFCFAVLATAAATANFAAAQSMSTGGRTTGGTGSTVTPGGTSGTGGSGGSSTGTTSGNQGTSSGNAGRQSTSGDSASTITRDADRSMSDVGVQSTGGARTGLGGLGALGGRGGFGGGGFGGLSPFGLNPFGAGANAAEARPTVRTRLRSEVAVPPRSPIAAQATMQYRVGRSLAQPRFRGVGTSFDGSTAVIAGTVGSEQDRRMAELLLRLEPGVSQIDNRIQVAR